MEGEGRFFYERGSILLLYGESGFCVWCSFADSGVKKAESFVSTSSYVQ